ncbi:MAG: guanylate kinase, partial [Bacteroidota bacterium]
MGQPRLILFCGPSGSGKTTIVKYLLENIPELSFSVSATTRKQRSNEVDGRDYYFISV